MQGQLRANSILNFFVLVFGIGFIGLNSQAYPELMRYKYNTCMACHVSPGGGGLLTTYGRGLSTEILSRWGSDKEAGFLHTALDTEQKEGEQQNPWYLLGGDVRSVQTHKENKIVRQGKYIPMQADIAVALQKDMFTFVGNVGEIKDDDHSWQPNGTQYYLMVRPQEEVTVRAGQFIPQYGLHLPDHILFIRSLLGFGMKSERDAIEAQYNGENWIASLTQSRQVKLADPEQATVLQVQYYFMESNKIAFNYWDGKSKGLNRSIVGLWGVFGFSPDLYWVSEWDLQKSKSVGRLIDSSATTDSTVHYNKLGYTLTKGLDVFLHEEAMQLDVRDAATAMTRRGLGLQFFPRPHFDFSAVWTKQSTNTNKETDYAWLLLHYYL